MEWETLAMRPKTLYLEVIEDVIDPCCLILSDLLSYLIQKKKHLMVKKERQTNWITFCFEATLLFSVFLSEYVMFYDMWINTSLLPDFDLLWGKH